MRPSASTSRLACRLPPDFVALPFLAMSACLRSIAFSASACQSTSSFAACFWEHCTFFFLNVMLVATETSVTGPVENPQQGYEADYW